MNRGLIRLCLKRCWIGLFVIGAVVLSLHTTGCAALEADPAPDSGFIPHPKKMAPWPERAQWVQRIWFKDRKQFYATRRHYTKICFKPTRTDYMLPSDWWDTLHSGGAEQCETETYLMARYIDTQMRATFANDPAKRLKITKTPDKDTIVYEFAIVELTPTKVAGNVVTTAIGFLLPPFGVVSKVIVQTRGSIAVEVTARDGLTNELLVAWADRKVDQLAIFTVKDFQAYGHARKAVDDWAANLLLEWRTPPTYQIENESVFTLDPT
jgi:hypothetical protein